MTVVCTAITQVAWTGDRQSMIDAHQARARQTAEQGAGIAAGPGMSTRADPA